MKFRRTALAFACLGSFVAAGPQRPKKDSSSSDANWAAKIVKVTQPDSVTIHKPRPPGEIGSPNNRNENPRDNQRWLVLTIECKAPPQSEITPEKVRIVDEASGVFRVLGHSYGENFVFFSEMPLGIAHRSGAIFIASLEKGVKLFAGEEKWQSETTTLLFSVSAASKRFYFQIGDGTRLPVLLQ